MDDYKKTTLLFTAFGRVYLALPFTQQLLLSFTIIAFSKHLKYYYSLINITIYYIIRSNLKCQNNSFFFHIKLYDTYTI